MSICLCKNQCQREKRTAIQRVEKVSTRWETSKKVGIFFVLAFVGVQGYARVRERKKQAQGFLDECLVLFFYNIIIIYTVTLFFL